MYETFEHTADLGLRIRADNLNDLFAEAGKALFSIILNNLEDVQTTEERPFTISGADVEELFHDWMTELLFTFHVYRRVLAKFVVNVNSHGLTARTYGELTDPRRHDLCLEVKAITWHGLKVEQTPTGWLAEVIIDI